MMFMMMMMMMMMLMMTTIIKILITTKLMNTNYRKRSFRFTTTYSSYPLSPHQTTYFLSRMRMYLSSQPSQALPIEANAGREYQPKIFERRRRDSWPRDPLASNQFPPISAKRPGRNTGSAPAGPYAPSGDSSAPKHEVSGPPKAVGR